MASSAMLDIRLAGGAEASGPAPSHMGGCTDTRAWRIPMHTRRTRYLLQRSEEHTSELQSRFDLVCRLLLEKKKDIDQIMTSRTNKQNNTTAIVSLARTFKTLSSTRQ